MTNKNNVDFEYHYHLSSPNPLPLESHLPAPSRVVWEASPRKSRSSNTQTHQLELDQDLATPLSAGWSFQASSERVHRTAFSFPCLWFEPCKKCQEPRDDTPLTQGCWNVVAYLMVLLDEVLVNMLLMVQVVGCCWEVCFVVFYRFEGGRRRKMKIDNRMKKRKAMKLAAAL